MHQPSVEYLIHVPKTRCRHIEESIQRGETSGKSISVPKSHLQHVNSRNDSRSRSGPEYGYHQAIGEDLDCLVWDVTKNVW